MRFYRRLAPFKAICFDLDDTLYPNRQVMVATEKAMAAYFSRELSAYHHEEYIFDRYYWAPFRQQVIAADCSLSDDVTRLRLETYYLGLLPLIPQPVQAREVAEKALSFFGQKRSEFHVPTSVHHLLAQLSKKYPLVAISNGNVNTDAIGISQYFTHIFMAGAGNIKKPDKDMFLQAANKLNVPLSALLHVGDCGHADVLGAQRAGMQSVWLSCYDVGKPIRTLPHVEISTIAQLERLI